MTIGLDKKFFTYQNKRNTDFWGVSLLGFYDHIGPCLWSSNKVYLSTPDNAEYQHMISSTYLLL